MLYVSFMFGTTSRTAHTLQYNGGLTVLSILHKYKTNNKKTLGEKKHYLSPLAQNDRNSNVCRALDV